MMYYFCRGIFEFRCEEVRSDYFFFNRRQQVVVLGQQYLLAYLDEIIQHEDRKENDSGHRGLNHHHDQRQQYDSESHLKGKMMSMTV